ncbi:hypothetical protein HYQ45_004620 [Verticillium longisporum]|uniref:Uncharacterized protein n=1 Tax=Verticillium longisporum TaxID=100787 RepID=A0A8I3AT58_VERLO|nr:hypothetical protein HYQ45_004620 [Verticillium longisporum]
MQRDPCACPLPSVPVLIPGLLTSIVLTGARPTSSSPPRFPFRHLCPAAGVQKRLSKMGFDERWLGALRSSLQCSDGVVSEEGRGRLVGRAGNLGQGQSGPPVTAPALPSSP